MDKTVGFTVTDVHGRVVGRVVGPMYGSSPSRPDALAVRSRGLRMRHFVVPAAAIEVVDDESRVIGIHLASKDLRRFL